MFNLETVICLHPPVKRSQYYQSAEGGSQRTNVSKFDYGLNFPFKSIHCDVKLLHYPSFIYMKLGK